MAKIFGIKPQAETRQLIEKFEDEVMIRHNNQQLVGNVYVDMQDDQWAVAFAYNYTRNPGIHGHENPLEVRYYCPVSDSSSVRMFRSDEDSERLLPTKALADGDAFIRFALCRNGPLWEEQRNGFLIRISGCSHTTRPKWPCKDRQWMSRLPVPMPASQQTDETRPVPSRQIATIFLKNPWSDHPL